MPNTCKSDQENASMEEDEISVQPVNPNSRKILDVQGDKRASKSGAHILHLFVLDHIPKLNCESVRGKFVVPSDRIHADTYH